MSASPGVVRISVMTVSLKFIFLMESRKALFLNFRFATSSKVSKGFAQVCTDSHGVLRWVLPAYAESRKPPQSRSPLKQPRAYFGASPRDRDAVTCEYSQGVG